MEGEAVYTLKDGRVRAILDAAGKYRFIKEFIKVRDRVPQLLGCGQNEEFTHLPSGV